MYIKTFDINSELTADEIKYKRVTVSASAGCKKQFGDEVVWCHAFSTVTLSVCLALQNQLTIFMSAQSTPSSVRSENKCPK